MRKTKRGQTVTASIPIHEKRFRRLISGMSTRILTVAFPTECNPQETDLALKGETGLALKEETAVLEGVGFVAASVILIDLLLGSALLCPVCRILIFPGRRILAPG
jgi:hypothetical protein